MIESIPNVSEGRRADVVDRLAAAVTSAPGVRLLDRTSDVSHHRSVLTVAGPALSIREAILALFAEAIAAIDLRAHSGVHPRLGAVDVVPFVPLGSVTMAECVALARETASIVADRFELPVFLYEAAATSPERRSLEQLFAESDFVTLHTALQAETRSLVNADLLAKAKKGIRIINAARGALIDEQALFDAVESGQVAGAAIDVFSEEPAVGNILTTSEKIVVTPHLAASTNEAQDRAGVDVAEQVIEVLAGGAP